MFNDYWQPVSVLMVALLFGGMLFFSAGFAAFLFKNLLAADARRLIRQAFPLFYLFVIISSSLGTWLTFESDSFSSTLLALIALTAIAARQLLMPAINKATDLGLKNRFLWLHASSVVVTLAHIVLSAIVLIQFIR